MFLLQERQTCSRNFSASFPLTQKLPYTSKSIRWFFVPPETTRHQRFWSSEASFCAFFTTCSWYFLNSGFKASPNATAFPAIRFSCGHPWSQGNTIRSIAFACSDLQRIIPHRGPRSVLWVVLVTASQYGTGFSIIPAATRPAIWAMSANKYAHTLSAIERKRFQSRFCEYAENQAIISFG